MVSYHTPEIKKQSKQWIEKGQPGPIKARVHANRTKQMLLAFFDNKDLIYTNIVLRGSMVNANYIVKALGTFMKSEEKEAGDGVPGLVLPLGQCAGPHCCHRPDVDESCCSRISPW
jgi:hypothetical protein